MKIFLILFYLVAISCEHRSIQKLDNTIWIDDNFENCSSTLEFKTNGEMMVYYCGIDKFFDARYSIKGDTVIVNEYHLVSQNPGSIGDKEIRFIYKFLIETNRLVQVYYSDLKYPHEKIGRDDSFVFQKTKL